MNPNPRATRRVSTRALVGWPLFTIAIVWLALVYADFDYASGIDGGLAHTNPALKGLDFIAGLFFTTPYIVTAIVCFGNFHSHRSRASARSQLVLRSARNGFRAAVILAVPPCAFLFFLFSVVGSSPAGRPVYGVRDGGIVAIGIDSLLVLGAGVVGAFFGAVWGLLRRLSDGPQLELNR